MGLGWGAMMGLGEGLKQFGGQLQENAKSKLAEKLAREKEQRDIDRQDRLAATTPVDWELIETAPGTWIKRGRNKAGDPIKDIPASTTEIEQATLGRQKDKLSLEQLTLGVDAAKYKQGRRGVEETREEEDRDLKRRYTEAQIRNLDEPNSRGGLGSRLSDTAETPSPSQMGIELAKAFPDLRKQYTEGEGALMTAEEYQHLAQGAVLEAAATKKDAITLFRAALRGRAAKNLAKKEAEEAKEEAKAAKTK